jgi:lambda family phage portal protein
MEQEKPVSSLINLDGTPLRAPSAAKRTTARYLRDTKSGALASRAAPLSNSRDDIRQAWSRSAGLAMDLIQNSGRLKGACDQVIADTVGVGLTLTPDPDMTGLEYSDEEKAEFIRLLKRRWKVYWGDKKECDLRGKLTGAQMVDIGLRWNIAYGEITGVFDFFGEADRARYGISTGTKLCLVSPQKLVQETREFEGVFQGVHHDDKGRPNAYRFETRKHGVSNKRDHAAFDTDGRPMVMHIFDPMDADDVRGISTLAPAFRKHIQAEMLDDATLQMALLQTIFAITLTSETPSADAYEALEVLKEQGNDGKAYGEEYLGYVSACLDKASDSRISVGADPQVSHLGPGQELGLKTANVPGKDFLPFSNSLAREMARAIGCSYGALTMDYEKATYSSVRMENSSIWSVVMRRRERIAAPMCQMSYENWLDEEIGEGRIPFKGGYQAFRANRNRVCMASWQGPAKPTADDLKSARASSERLKNGTSSIAIETGDLGIDADALFEERQREHQRYLDAGMASPYAQDADLASLQVEAVE